MTVTPTPLSGISTTPSSASSLEIAGVAPTRPGTVGAKEIGMSTLLPGVITMGTTVSPCAVNAALLPSATHHALKNYEELGRADPASQENAGYIAAVHARIAELEHQR